MAKEYMAIAALMTIFSVSAVKFVTDVGRDQLCTSVPNAAAQYDFCKKEGK